MTHESNYMSPKQVKTADIFSVVIRHTWCTCTGIQSWLQVHLPSPRYKRVSEIKFLFCGSIQKQIMTWLNYIINNQKLYRKRYRFDPNLKLSFFYACKTWNHVRRNLKFSEVLGTDRSGELIFFFFKYLKHAWWSFYRSTLSLF